MTTAAQDEVDRLFDEWKELRDRAWATADMRDGLAAGKAWGRYMRAFEKFTESEASRLVVPPGRNVLPFKPGGGPPPGGNAA